MSEINKQNVGNAGEYYFASRLSALNFVVTITLGRAEKYDILCVTPKEKTFKISVKTRFETKIKFPLSKKDEYGGADDFYYALFFKINKTSRDLCPPGWIQELNKYYKKMFH